MVGNKDFAAVGQYSDNYDATMRPMRQTLVLILAMKVAVGRSVLQPATISTYGSVNLRNEINKCTCMKYVSSRDSLPARVHPFAIIGVDLQEYKEYNKLRHGISGTFKDL
jgi:hypothetical protein